MPQRRWKRAQKGVIMLLFGVMLMFVLVPAVGLALDLGIAYALKARLQSASDGAAIAAMRSLGQGLTDSARQVIATDTAQRFFNANLQSAGFGLSNPTVNISFPASAPNTTTLQINVTVTMPTYFMRLVGSPTMTLATTSATARRDVNLMLVIDRSGSLQTSGSCPALIQAAENFVLQFREGRDEVGLITFGTSYNADNLLRSNFRTSSPSVITNIGNIVCTGWTNSAAAYSAAYDQLVAANQTNVLNVILFFTDGQPNTVTMPRMLLNMGSGCMPNGNRFGVVTPGGGIYQAMASSLPPVPGDSYVIPNDSGCAIASDSSLTGLSTDFAALTRSAADGDTGDANGDNGSSAVGDYTQGHGYGPAGSGARWNGWPGDQDAFGNSLFGYKSVSTDGAGRITLDATSITNAGTNALANAADRVRTDSIARGLNVITYVIGLGNASGPPEQDLLNRVANSTASPVFDPTKPVGAMVFASGAGELEAAFATISSELLRIAM